MTSKLGNYQLPGAKASELATANELLKPRELRLETDTGRMKIGDGIKTYNELPYIQATVRYPLAGEAAITGNIEALPKHGDSLVEFTGGSLQKYTLKAGANMPPVGSTIIICMAGSGKVEVVGSSVTVHPQSTPKTTTQWSHLAIRVRSATDVVVTGEFE